MGFGLLLMLVVALLFGLAPALRASGVEPVHALKGGEEPQTKSRSMHALIAMQVAFCFGRAVPIRIVYRLVPAIIQPAAGLSGKGNSIAGNAGASRTASLCVGASGR